MKDKPVNIAASVRDRLASMAKKRGGDTELLLTRYVLERLLYRLSLSSFRDEFVLKGAMLQALWMENPFRDTRDLDLHGRGQEDASRMLETFRAVLATEVPDDGVVFNVDTLAARPLRENVSYGGVKITTTAKLGSAHLARAR
jgi:predicted nucleotidyltransferase component of viral defense system